MNKTPKIIEKWLMLGAILVLLMIVIGGITRLTESGLSIVHWKPITGILPPLNETAWQTEFEHYQSSPEFQIKNAHFTLDNFKKIFFWEYLHRFLGRLTGIVFIIPFLYFSFTRKIKDPKLFKNLLIILLLGALQGYAGWYMVQSGLVDNPHVSHYRLAIHLGLALILLCFIVWEILKIRIPIINYVYPKHQKIRNLLRFTFFLLGTQIIFGAFMSGLKAGFVYPTFPKMGKEWLPESITNAFQEMGLMSFVENPISVQFIHRWLGASILLFILWVFIKSRKEVISASQSKSIKMILHTTTLQFILGVLTLLFSVPIFLGVLHQLIAVMLLMSLVVSYYLFKYKT
ncbi:MAG: COX15/CtaA family protein [Flavobacteriaceae bacterium]|nr:COX15/CtaA family protein [Flavobacteriaceae bacterium]